MKYTSRDAQSNIENLMEDAKAITTLWQPGSESDPGIVLLKSLAAEVDMLSFNLDTQVDEMYMQSATQIKSIRRLGVANGYVPRWYRAPRTRLRLENTGTEPIALDFTFPTCINSICFATENALGDLKSIPYFVLPNSAIGESDAPTLQPAGSTNVLGRTDVIYRDAAQGLIKNSILNPASLNPTGNQVESLSTRLPSQNVDTDLVWVQEVTGGNLSVTDVRWEYDGGSGFIDNSDNKPKYQIGVDDYNNVVVMFNRAINDTIQKGNYIRIYYLETYGTVGEIAPNVLKMQGITSTDFKLTHSGNTFDIPDGSALTGRAPMTAHEAALDAKNWVNTNDSIITLPNFEAWINRQDGISTGIAVDCQEALELNWAIRYNEDMDPELKPLKYLLPGDITLGKDFPINVDANGKVWDPLQDSELDYPHNFLIYKLMYYCIFNNFMDTWFDGVRDIECSDWSQEYPSEAAPYRRYRPSVSIRNMLKRLYTKTQNLTAQIDFGYIRVFEWAVNGVIWTKSPITDSDAKALESTVMKALRLRFNAKNMKLGELPMMMDVVDCVQNADERIRYFDAGLLNSPMIEWVGVRDFNHRTVNSELKCDIRYFNAISFARFVDGDTLHVPDSTRMSKISVARECIKREV